MSRSLLAITLILGLAAAPMLLAQDAGSKRPATRGGGHGEGELRITPIHNEAEVYLRNVRQVTYEGLKSGEGYFSPDHKKIAFQSVRGDCPHYQIFVKDLDGTRLVRASTGEGLTTCAHFHPRQPSMIWASTHLDRDSWPPVPPEAGRYAWNFHPSFDIFSSDLEGRNVKRLTDAADYDAEGSFSPCGTRITFCSKRTGDPEIWTMASDGSDLHQVTHAAGYDGGPFYSPDGKLICFRGFRDPENPRGANLYVINADGSDERQLTFDTGVVNWAPYFHPAGQYLIYTRNVGGHRNFELFMIPVAGGKSVQITHHEMADVLPVFSPDGTRLMWTSTRGTGRSQLFMADFVMPEKEAFSR
jgi:Tol biopolymer transport system component